MNLLEDVIHGIPDGTRDSTVDGRGGRLVGLGPGIRGNTASRDGAVAQRPEEFTVPGFTRLRRGLDISQGTRHTLVSRIDGFIDRRAILCLQSIFFVPDILRCRLQRDLSDTGRNCLEVRGCGHASCIPPWL